jgi:hypothetical protein
MKNAAFGIRVHSGWAVLVCVSGDPTAAIVVDRRRIVIIKQAMEGAKQPYHFAENLGFEEAERHLQKCVKSLPGNIELSAAPCYLPPVVHCHHFRKS